MTARRPAFDSILNALLFAALILGTSAIFKIARAMGVIDDPDLGRRVSMVIFGVFLASIGNATPKILTPLSELSCDVVKVQALQRFMGWTWMLTGLGVSLVWLVLPVIVAKSVTVALIGVAALTLLAQMVRVCRPRHTGA